MISWGCDAYKKQKSIVNQHYNLTQSAINAAKQTAFYLRTNKYIYIIWE